MDVVVVNAIVTDKQGNPVKDLKVDEFKVYEDGKLQPIHTFALESYKATQAQDIGTTSHNSRRGYKRVTVPHDQSGRGRPRHGRTRVFYVCSAGSAEAAGK